jgi:hypothetical protein
MITGAEFPLNEVGRLCVSVGKMAKKFLLKLLRGDPKDVSKMASLLSHRPTGVRESASRFQSLYKKFPLM